MASNLLFLHIVPSDLSNVVAIVAGFARNNAVLRSDGTVDDGDCRLHFRSRQRDCPNVVAIAAAQPRISPYNKMGTLVTGDLFQPSFRRHPDSPANITAISACYYNFTAFASRWTAGWVWGFDNYGNTLPPSRNNIVKLEAAVDFILAVTDEGRGCQGQHQLQPLNFEAGLAEYRRRSAAATISWRCWKTIRPPSSNSQGVRRCSAGIRNLRGPGFAAPPSQFAQWRLKTPPSR